MTLSDAITSPGRIFIIVWTTQLISALGTGLTEFALGVFVYQRTGSTTEFALVLVCAMVPAILLSPYAGALADRMSRRHLMLWSNAASGMVILLLTIVRAENALSTWLIYVAAFVLAVCGAFRDPAYYASVGQLVSRKQLGRASGLVQTAENVGQVTPPLLAGVMLVSVGLSGILIFDLATYALGVIALAVVVFPPVTRDAQDAGPPTSVWHDMAEGWRYILRYRGFLYAFLFGSFVSFCVGLTQVVITPLVLSFASAAVLGATFSAGGLGMFLGGAAMAAWGGPKNRVAGILGFGLAQVPFLIIAGLRANAIIIAIGLFGYLLTIQFVRGCTAALIREHVPAEVQGRVFALNRMVAWSTLPIAYLLAGPLSDAFDVLLKPHGPLAGTVGSVIGTGAHRGMGFLLIALAALMLVSVVASWANPRLRHVETEMRAAALPGTDVATPAR
jgi:MFS family permease